MVTAESKRNLGLQSLDKEQQAHRKRLTEMVVYGDIGLFRTCICFHFPDLNLKG